MMEAAERRALADVIADLQWSYGIERDYRTAAFPSLADTPVGTCRYCGKQRTSYANTKLDGHARCVVSDAWRRSLVAAMTRDPRLSYALVATSLGVSDQTVRAWYRAGSR